MKTPTDGTKVFKVGDISSSTLSTPFPVDAFIHNDRMSNGANSRFSSRLTGSNRRLITSNTNAESLDNGDSQFGSSGDGSSYKVVGAGLGAYAFRRAPGFFDQVAYTGNGVARTIPHNLGVTPELMIVKSRTATSQWYVYHKDISTTKELYLASTSEANTPGTTFYNFTNPTNSVFSLGVPGVNVASNTYTAYLYATLPGISKVGSYTGDGTTGKVINAGFTGGAKYIMIKRTDSTGDWLVWDTARGIVAGNDPHISLNTTTAEVTTDDSVDPENSGFIINQNTATNINKFLTNENISNKATTAGFMYGNALINNKVLFVGGDRTNLTYGKVVEYDIKNGTTNVVYTSPVDNDVFKSIAYGNGKYVVVGNRGSQDPDMYYLGSSLSSLVYGGRIFNSNYTGNIRVVFGNGKFIASAMGNGGASGIVATSTDGVTWTTQVVDVSNTTGGIFFVNGYFILLGTGKLHYSTDGSTWNLVTLPTTYSPKGIAYANGKYVLITSDVSNFLTSTNLTDWTVNSVGNMFGNQNAIFDNLYSYNNVIYYTGYYNYD